MNYHELPQKPRDYVSWGTEAMAVTQARPVRFGVAGLGGFASYVTDRLLEPSAQPFAHLVATCDPHLEKFASRSDWLRKRGVTVVDSFQQLLEQEIDAVWLPVPIDLHRPFTEAALAAGKAVLCEKPAAASIDDVDAMIQARDRAGLAVLIGFQDMYQPSVGQLKGRILSGEFGTARSVTVIGCWPRGEKYFRRNDWAGRYRRDGRWVMDSPASNALAHFLHLPLFLLGPSLHAAANPVAVAGELYRANPIENYDTCMLRVTLPGQVPVLAAFTHACAESVEPEVVLQMQKASIHYCAHHHIEIRSSAGVERLPLLNNPHKHMLKTFYRCFHREAPAEMCASLEMARAHVLTVNLASETAPVVEVPAEFIRITRDSEGHPLRTINGIVPALKSCIEHKRLLHEAKLVPWSSPSATHAVNGYSRFSGPCFAGCELPPPKHAVDVTVFPSQRISV